MTGSLARLRATALASLLLGLSYWLSAPARTSGSAYDAVRDVASLSTWGLLLTLTSVPLLWAIGRHDWTCGISSALAAGWHGTWALLFLLNAQQQDVALAGAIVFGFLAYLHVSLALASGREIAERD